MWVVHLWHGQSKTRTSYPPFALKSGNVQETFTGVLTSTRLDSPNLLLAPRSSLGDKSSLLRV